MSPLDEALSRFHALEEAGLTTSEGRKRFYQGMSEVFRLFLGAQFSISTLDLTTAELRFRLRSIEHSEEWREAALTWLAECDLVKYAKSEVDQDEALLMLERAVSLVRRIAAAGRTPQEVARA